MNDNIADEIRKTIESIKDMKTQASGINNYLSVLEEMMRADIQKKVDEAYQRGLEEGKKATWGLVADASSAEYQRGLDDAWEAARKIVEMSDPPYWELFDEYKENLFGKISASEAIEKLKAYEEKADKDVKRGDVVRSKVNGLTYIVTIASEGGYVLLGSDGNFATSCITNSFEKTGGHFDIDKILEEMKE